MRQKLTNQSLRCLVIWWTGHHQQLLPKTALNTGRAITRFTVSNTLSSTQTAYVTLTISLKVQKLTNSMTFKNKNLFSLDCNTLKSQVHKWQGWPEPHQLGCLNQFKKKPPVLKSADWCSWAILWQISLYSFIGSLHGLRVRRCKRIWVSKPHTTLFHHTSFWPNFIVLVHQLCAGIQWYKM